MGKLVLIFVLILSLRLTAAFGHGESAPGPNGGFIRMPGGYHTELVPVDARTFKIYLLDFDFKNPTTEDSSVRYELGGTAKGETACVASGSHFQCRLPAGSKFETPGTLSILSRRAGQPGAVVKYQLPLKPEAHGH